MGFIRHYYKDKVKGTEEKGTIAFNFKYDEDYYRKIGMTKWDNHYGGVHPSLILSYFRYINWSDHTDFIISGRSSLPSLARKSPREYVNHPREFDHTSFWRKRGARWPSFCITEPYYIGEDNMEEFFQEITESVRDKYGLKFKVFPRSEKSLYYPNQSFFIFGWCPSFFDFEANKKLLFSHEDAKDFEAKCEKITF